MACYVTTAVFEGEAVVPLSVVLCSCLPPLYVMSVDVYHLSFL